jgi:transposase-like protein
MPNSSNPGERGRFSSRRKTEAVLRLLRGESIELISRELGVTAATLATWREDFLAGGQAALKSRPADDRDDEIARLRSKVGELTMDNELLLQRCRAERPFVPRRRRP